MNTLVIGNGFDIEHGLPTKYVDFLNYLQLAEKIFEQCKGKSILSSKDNLSHCMDHYNGPVVKTTLKKFKSAQAAKLL